MGCCFSNVRGVLNAQNNGSYAYLQSIGNEWTYQPKDVHPKLHTRYYRRFDTLNLEDHRRMRLHEVLLWPDDMRQLVGANDNQIEDIRNAVRILCTALGVTEEGLHRRDWVEAVQVFAEAERERRKRGEQSLVSLLGDSYFDVLDRDGDGTVGIDELKIVMSACQLPQETAYTFFHAADVDKSDRLEREEVHDVFHKFWLEPYDSKYDYIYA